MNNLLHLTIAALVSVTSVNWIFLKVLKIAKTKGLVDNPDARKLQKAPVPMLGGIAVYFGLLLGLLTFIAIAGYYNIGYIANLNDPRNPSALSPLLPVALCSSVMLYVGSMDDILSLKPSTRLFIEVLVLLGLIYGSGICVDNLYGLWGINQFSWWIGVPLTVFAGVGIINAYNMVDGVNGLSSGLCIACSCVLASIFWKRGDYVNSALAICFAGALIPFLLHNVFGRESRMFLGDGGTMVMGLLVSWFMIRVLSSNNDDMMVAQPGGYREMGLVAMMLAVASVPVFDTLRVMTARILRGESPFHADKTHLHHAFIATGTSHSITALSEILIDMTIVLIWLLIYRLGYTVDVQLYVVIILSVLLIWGPYFLLTEISHKHPESRFMEWTKKTHLGHSNWWLSFQQRLDHGAYEDYYIVFIEELKKDPYYMNLKEKDTLAIFNYIKGKKSVLVTDILQESGAAPTRIPAILQEMEQNRIIDVLQRNDDHTPSLVKTRL